MFSLSRVPNKTNVKRVIITMYMKRAACYDIKISSLPTFLWYDIWSKVGGSHFENHPTSHHYLFKQRPARDRYRTAF